MTLSGTVSPGSGSGTPTGDVAFIVSQGAIGDTVNQNTGAMNGPVAFATLSADLILATLNNLPGGTTTSPHAMRRRYLRLELFHARSGYREFGEQCHDADSLLHERYCLHNQHGQFICVRL